VNAENIVELKGITKRFPGVLALDNVNFEVKKGSVHALIGENGAGKSTLMKILSGAYVEYEGNIVFCGKEIHFNNEKEALDSGIAIVPQEINPISELTIAENVYIGREPQKKLKGFIDKRKRLKDTQEFMDRLGLGYDANKKMADLSVAQKQMVEIIKAISRNAKLIIMDEPTSALTAAETEHLFYQINRLREDDISIIFISHKLDEVFTICDEATVLRDGQYIGSCPISETDVDTLISMMVGREVKDIFPKLSKPQGEEVLRVEHLESAGKFHDINFTLKKGEILGFAGLMGSGRSEIVRSIFGLDSITGGSIFLSGQEIAIGHPKDAIHQGIAMVTEDRAVYGFVGIRSIKDNIALPNCDRFAPYQWIRRKEVAAATDQICTKLKVKAENWDSYVGTLSGGNQQKVVLAKWLIRDIKVLILDEPTRGIDVGAKQEIYRLIADLAASGMAVILISSELPEVLSMSHRIKVLTNGSFVGDLDQNEATQDAVMKKIVEGRNVQ